MNKKDYLLTCLIEECVEVAQRGTKILRFGWDEVQEGQDLNNQNRLSNELSDLAALIEMLRDESGVWLPVYATSAKKERVKKYMKLSQEQGRLEND